MKKALALILAIAMLSTMAFAMGAWGSLSGSAGSVHYQVNPGTQIAVDPLLFKAVWDAAGKTGWSDAKITKDNFSIVINYKDGANLVTESWGNADYSYGYFLKFNDDKTKIRDGKADVVISRIYIKLKDDTGANLTLKYQDSDATLQPDSLYVKGKATPSTYLFTGGYRIIGGFDVGYYVYWYKTNAKKEPHIVFEDWAATTATGDSSQFNNKDIFKSAVVTTGVNDSYYNLTPATSFDKGAYTFAHGMDNTGLGAGPVGSYMVGYYDSTGSTTQKFTYYSNDAAYKMSIDFTLNKGQYVWIKEDDISKHEKLYDALEAKATEAGAKFDYIMYANGNAAFKTAANVNLFADEDQFLYEFDADGNLSKTAFVWDDDMGYYTAKLKTLGNYLVSDVELDVAGAADDTNPDTGANDVVGIASALAVVALISAAAISLKK